MLAGLILDIGLIVLLIICVVLGVKEGYRGTVIHTIFSIAITLIGAVIVGLITMLISGFLGVSKGVSDWIFDFIEKSQWMYNMFITAEALSQYLALGFFFIVGFFVGIGICGGLYFLIVRLLNKLRDFTWYRIIDNIVGVTLNVGVYLGVLVAILIPFALCENTCLFVNTREFIRSTFITGYLYKGIASVLQMGSDAVGNIIPLANGDYTILGALREIINIIFK